MSRRPAFTDSKLASMTWPGFKGLENKITSVGTTAIPIPATNLSNRKGILICNLDTAKTVYLGGSIPEIIVGVPTDDDGAICQTSGLRWQKSAGGTNEWYCTTKAGGDPGLRQPVRMYYQLTSGTVGVETLATLGAVGSIAAEHGYAWGDGDTLGFSTIYVRTNGAVLGSSPAIRYRVMMTYAVVPDASATYGYPLGPGDAIYWDVSGSARVFAIASAASANVSTVEFV